VTTMKWPEVNGSDPESWLGFDPEIVFEDVDEFMDPIIVTAGAWDRTIVMLTDDQRTLVEGIQVHTCPYAESGRIYVMDRAKIVDETGICLVCGEDTN